MLHVTEWVPINICPSFHEDEPTGHLSDEPILGKESKLSKKQCYIKPTCFASTPGCICSRCLLKCLHVTLSLPFLLYAPHAAWSYIKFQAAGNSMAALVITTVSWGAWFAPPVCTWDEWNVGTAIHSSFSVSGPTVGQMQWWVLKMETICIGLY